MTQQQQSDHIPEAKKMVPGDELHLTLLMAPFSLNFFTGQDRQHLLAFGRAAFEAGQAAAQQAVQAVVPSDADIDAAIQAFDWDGWIDQGKAKRAFTREALARWAAPAHPAEGVPAPMPVPYPHHCTARTADGFCEECEGHAQAMAEWNAERAAIAAAHPTQQGMDAEHWAELYRLREEGKRSDGTPWQKVAAQERALRDDMQRAISNLPRYTYGYKADEWGMNNCLQTYQDNTGKFLMRDEVLAALAAQAKQGGAA